MKMNDTNSGTGRQVVLWVLAVVLTLATAYYQRRTGPTRPLRVSYEMAGEPQSGKLVRTEVTTEDALVEVPAPEGAEGRLLFKRFGTEDPFETALMEFKDGRLTGSLPAQPPAGKLDYHLRIRHGAEEVRLPEADDEQVTIRFKGAVPLWVLLPHILFMFLSLLIGLRTGLAAAFAPRGLKELFGVTFACLTLGGMLLGPFVQKYAFGEFWTGWPNGKDLTDNKTLIMWLGWAAAGAVVLLLHRKKLMAARIAVILATALMITMYLIPHSLRGSSLNYQALDEGKSALEAIETGK
jgi:hypothetical protein